MTNPYRYALLTFLKLADLGVITVAFVLAVMTQLHQPQPWVSLFEMRIQVQNVLFLLVFLCYCHLLLRSLGLYRSYRLTAVSREWRDLAGVAVVAAMSLYLSGRVLGFNYAKAEFGPAVACMIFIGLAIERRAFRLLARAVRRHGHNIRNVVLLGRDESGFDLASRLARRADLGYAIEAVVDVHASDEEAALTQVTSLLETWPIDEVFITLPLDAHQGLIRDVVSVCEEQGVTIRVLSSLVDLVRAPRAPARRRRR